MKKHPKRRNKLMNKTNLVQNVHFPDILRKILWSNFALSTRIFYYIGFVFLCFGILYFQIFLNKSFSGLNITNIWWFLKVNMKHLFEVLGPFSTNAKNGVSTSNRFCTGLSEKFVPFFYLCLWILQGFRQNPTKSLIR